MNKNAILVVGTNETVIKNAVRSINGNTTGDVVSASGSEAAIEKFHQRDFTVVVFTACTGEEEKKLRKIFTLQNPGIMIITSSPGEQLADEIIAATERKRNAGRPTFSFLDDALKNARLPVTIQ